MKVFLVWYAEQDWQGFRLLKLFKKKEDAEKYIENEKNPQKPDEKYSITERIVY